MWTARDILALTGTEWTSGSAGARWTGTTRLWWVLGWRSPDAFALASHRPRELLIGGDIDRFFPRDLHFVTTRRPPLGRLMFNPRSARFES